MTLYADGISHFGMTVANISTTIGSLHLKNPTILASGIMDEDAGSMQRIISNGAGAIVTKSIGVLPREGYPNPSLLELENGLLNAMGLPNPGIEHYGQEMKKMQRSIVPIIGSIFGANSKEFTVLAQKMERYGASAVELNVSCPHAKHYGLEVGCDATSVQKIVSSVKGKTHIPVFVKISPNVTNIVEIAKAAERGNADGIVAINTIKAMKIDLDSERPILAHKTGGYSGRAIKPIGIRCVYEISEQVTIPIIGVGGITTGEDAIEYFMAGASAVQIGSAVYYRGVDVFRHICKEISQWMNSHHYQKISELIGVAHL